MFGNVKAIWTPNSVEDAAVSVQVASRDRAKARRLAQEILNQFTIARRFGNAEVEVGIVSVGQHQFQFRVRIKGAGSS